MLAMAIPGMLAVPIAFKRFQDLDMKWVKIVVIFVVATRRSQCPSTACRREGTEAAAYDRRRWRVPAHEGPAASPTLIVPERQRGN
jgi:hypothetical protein